MKRATAWVIGATLGVTLVLVAAPWALVLVVHRIAGIAADRVELGVRDLLP